MTHFVVAGHLLDARPSGATGRLLGVLNDLPELLESDERVTVLHGRGLPAAARIDGLDWVATSLPASPTWRRALAERLGLGRILSRLHADVVELTALPVPAHLPCPVALTVHDVRDLDPEFARRPPWVARAMLRRALARASHVLVPSQFTKERLAEVAPNATPVSVVPGGVAGDMLAIEPHSDPHRRHFLHVGHLERRKDLGTLLSAYARFRRLHREPSPPRLVLAGADHGMGRALRRQANALGIGEHVDFAGAVDDPTLRSLYAHAAAVTIPSRHEGFGLPALEALAVGVPVLVADAGASPEVVGSAARVLPPGDVEIWAHALLAAAQQRSTPEDIATRKDRAREFTWRRTATATLAIWRELVR